MKSEGEAVTPGLQGAVAVVAIGALLWTTRSVLVPPILFGVVWVALHPFRDRRGVGALLLSLGGVTLLWVLATTGGLLAPFLVALALAYVLDPLVDRLEQRGTSRTTAILVLTGPVLLGGALVAIFGFPALGRQVTDVIRNLPDAVARLQGWVASFQGTLGRVPLLGPSISEVIATLDGEALSRLLAERQAELARQGWQAFLGIGRGLGSVVALLGYIVLTPVLAFYLLRDWHKAIGEVEELLPLERRDAVVVFAQECDLLLGQYLRGQMTVALLVGALTALGLWVWSFPYALLIGGFVTLFSVVPYLGLLLSLIPALAVALASGAIGASLLKVAVVFGVVQVLDGTVISPRIVGGSVGLHPVWVVLALSAGGFYLGFVGLLLGVPMAVGVKLIAIRIVERYRASGVYGAPPRGADT
ncbi:MAG: AI-2E family transporter [Longimicrobiales bacterium]|nr:AI-2E family transporter [Longimicrobiales bacterium]